MSIALSAPGALVLLAGAAAHVAHGVAATPVHQTAGQAATGGSATAPTVSAGHLLVQLLLALGVVLVLVLGAKRLLHGRGGALGALGSARRSPIRVLGRHSLGKGVSVAVIQFGDDAYLVGVTPTAVRRLAVTDARHLEAAGGDGAGALRPRRGADPAATTLGRALSRLSPALGGQLTARARATGSGRALPTTASSVGDEGAATVVDLVPQARSARTISAGDGTARTASSRGARPAPTWTSAIEHLRERTVRRA